MASDGSARKLSSFTGGGDVSEEWNVPKEAVQPDRALVTGDIIYLEMNRNDFDGYISSEGFVDNRITVLWFREGSGDLPEKFSQCLFRVLPKRNYKAQSQIRKLEKKASATFVVKEQADYSLIKEQEEKERGQNEQAEREAIRDERPFKYGDICQLQHVLTGKFITMDGNALAEADNEALRINLVENGGKGSWLEFRPRFKNRAMGQPIIIGDQLVFNHRATQTQFLRVSDGSLRFSEGSVPEMTQKALEELESLEDCKNDALQYFTRRCELNLSAQQPYTALKLSLYSPGSAEGVLDQETGKTVLNLQMGTMALRLFHAESDAMVSASANQNAAFHPTNSELKKPYLFKKKADEDDDLDDEKNLISKSLWIIESANRCDGGGLNIAGDPQVTKEGETLHPVSDLVRIRHAVSGRYLAVDHSSVTAEVEAFEKLGLTKLENTGPIFDARLCETCNVIDRERNPALQNNPNATDDDDVRTLFKLHSVVAPQFDAEDTCPILTMEDIETQNIWIEHPFVRKQTDIDKKKGVYVVDPITVGDDDEDGLESCWLHSTQVPKASRKGDNSLLDRKNLTLKFCGNCLDEDSLQIFVAKENELSNVDNLLACHPLASMYYDRVQNGGVLAKDEEAFVMGMLKYLILFALGRVDEIDNIKGSLMLVDGTPEESNQQLLRESKMIDALFLMLSAPTDAKLELGKLKDDYPQLEAIHNLVLKAIKFTFLGNFRNELYLADHCLKDWNYGHNEETFMKSLVHSLESHEEAALVYQQLVSNNKKLLETRINFSDVQIFMNLIQKRGPVAEFLQFLTAICACMDEPLVQNQELMLKVMYSASRQIGNEVDECKEHRYKFLIETIVDPRDEGGAAFDRPFSSSTNTPTNTKGVMGGRIIENGSWSNLLIGWYGSDSWTENKEETAFFFSPDKIGIEIVDVDFNLLPTDLKEYHQKANMSETGKKFQWVRLRDVLWTLQPDVMKRKAGGDGFKGKQDGWTYYQEQMKTDEVLKANFERTRDLAEYYAAQIELYATMCFDRSYNCMGHLEKQFSFEVLVTAVADSALPDTIRSAFTQLLYVLYVDKYPQEKLYVPNLVRPETDVKPMRFQYIDGKVLADEDAFPRFQYVNDEGTCSDDLDKGGVNEEDSSPTKFYILQEVIKEHMHDKLKGLNVLSMKELNTLTLRMLICLEKLFFSGFYSTYEQMQTFVESAVKLLDGRSDVDDVTDLLKDGIHFMDRRPTEHVEAYGRGTVLQKGTIAQPKHDRSGKGILGRLGVVKDDESGIEASTREKSGSIAGAASEESAFEDSQLRPRYTPSAESTVAIEIKRRIMSTLSMMSDITLDFRVTNVLNSLKTTDSEDLFSNKASEFGMSMRFSNVSDTEHKEECLSENAVAAFLALFSGREDADKPFICTDDRFSAAWAQLKGGDLIGGVTGAGGDLIGGVAGGLKSGLALIGGDSLDGIKRDAIAMRMNSLCHPQPFVSICLDLMMYQDDLLFDAAMEAYVNFFMEMESVVNSLENVQVLESEAQQSNSAEAVSADQATNAKNNLALLQFQIDTFETWGEETAFAEFTQKTYDDVLRYMRCVTNFMLVPNHEVGDVFQEPEDISACQAAETRQNIMFNFKAHETMKEILEIDSSEAEIEKGANSTTHRLKDFAIAFLIVFVADNDANQIIVFESMLDLLLENIKSLEDAPELLAAIFQDNSRLNTKVPRDLLEKLMEVNFTRMQDKLPPKADYLEMFMAIVSSDGAPNPENQKMALEVLTQEQFECLLFNQYWKVEGEDSMSTLFNFSQSIATLKASKGYGEFRKYMQSRPATFERQSSSLLIEPFLDADTKSPEWIDAYMAYMTGLVTLLANVAAGKNTHGELKCQSQVPLVFVMALLGDEAIANVPAFRVSILFFLTEVFFDTDLAEFSTALPGQEEFWNLMESQCKDIEQYVKDDVLHLDTSGEDREDEDDYEHSSSHYIFNGVLPSLEGFVINCLEDSNQDEDLSADTESTKRGDLLSMVVKALSELGRHEAKFSPAELDVLRRVIRVMNTASRGEEQVIMRVASTKPRGRKSSIRFKRKEGITLSSKLADFVKELKKDPRIHKEVADEKTRLVENLLDVKKWTDKKDELYKACCDLTDRVGEPGKRKTLGEVVVESDPRDFAISHSRLITRMVEHTRKGCDETDNAEVQRKTIWVLGRVLEHHLPADVRRNVETYEIDDHESEEDENAWKWKLLWWVSGGLAGGSHLSADQDLEESKAKHVAIQNELDEYGCSKLVIDVIGESKDEHVVLEAIKLGIEMLEFGNQAVQATMFEYFDELGPGADKFFSRISHNIEVGTRLVRDRRQRQKYVEKFGGSLTTAADDDEDFIRLDLVFRLLQLFTEGHNNDMQNLIRDQSSIGCRNSYNLLQQSVEYLTAVAKNPKQLARMTEGDAEDAVRVLDFLIEALQGPCEANQDMLANTVMVDICAYIIRSKISKSVNIDDRKKLKSLAAKALLSLLEGREDMTLISQLAQKLEAVYLRNRMVTIHHEYMNLQEISSGRVGGSRIGTGLSKVCASVKGMMSKPHSSNKSVGFVDLQEERQGLSTKEGYAAGVDELPEEVHAMLETSDWDEEFLEEGFDLLKLADKLSSPEACESSKACKEFHDKLSLTPTKKPLFGDFKKPKDFTRALKLFNSELEFAQARSFFHKQMRIVEIVWRKPGASEMTVEPMLFPEPSECSYMPVESRERVRNLLDYGTEDRMTQLITEESQALIAEMQHLERLGKYYAYVIIGKNLALVKYLGFMVSILMNTLLLICLVAPHGSELEDGKSFTFEPAYMGDIVFAFGLVQLGLGVIILAFILASRAPLVFQEQERNRTKLELNAPSDLFALAEGSKKLVKDFFIAFRSMIISMVMVTMIAVLYYLRYLEEGKPFPEWYPYILIVLTFVNGASGLRAYLSAPTSPITFTYVVGFDVMAHKETAFYLLYVVCALLGLGTPWFYSYHLLYLVVASEELQNVVRAVTVPIQALSLTFVLLFMIVYMFTFLYFIFQRDRFWNEDLAQNECNTLGRCFIVFMRNGLLSGGGIGDYVAGELGHPPQLNETDDLFLGTLMDLLYFVIVLVLLLNIVFGIIIDTFGSLREEGNERQEYLKNSCFLSLRDREPFEEKRSMWNYLYLMVYLLHHKDSTDYTGPETEIAKAMNGGDISWVPGANEKPKGYYSLEESAEKEAPLNLL